jgi:pyridoxal phosphate enzyme (YggS family)
MIKDNIARIRDRVSSICKDIKRKPEEVIIVAVSKGRTVEEIKEAIGAGITDIGENKVQEALLKYKQLQTPNSDLPTIRWHMVGHLQTNKVKEAVKIFDLIHSVDSIRLIREIDRQAAKINKVQDILLEIKTSPEATKFGINPQEAVTVIKESVKLNNIRIKGLMTIAPIVSNPEQARPYFRILRELRDKIYELRFTNYDLRILSMGMTDDFPVAIEEGANILRLGRAIFG